MKNLNIHKLRLSKFQNGKFQIPQMSVNQNVGWEKVGLFFETPEFNIEKQKQHG